MSGTVVFYPRSTDIYGQHSSPWIDVELAERCGRRLHVLLYPCHNVLEVRAAILCTAVQQLNTLLAVSDNIVQPHQRLQLDVIH